MYCHLCTRCGLSCIWCHVEFVVPFCDNFNCKTFEKHEYLSILLQHNWRDDCEILTLTDWLLRETIPAKRSAKSLSLSLFLSLSKSQCATYKASKCIHFKILFIFLFIRSNSSWRRWRSRRGQENSGSIGFASCVELNGREELINSIMCRNFIFDSKIHKLSSTQLSRSRMNERRENMVLMIIVKITNKKREITRQTRFVVWWISIFLPFHCGWGILAVLKCGLLKFRLRRSKTWSVFWLLFNQLRLQ